MRRTIKFLTLPALFIGIAAWAQAPDNSDQGTQTTTVSEAQASKGLLKDEVVGVKPEVGVMSYNDSNGSTAGRAVYGIGLDFNASGMAKGTSFQNFYLGVSSGAIFSHLGDPTSNFWGTNPSSGGSIESGSNFLMIPTDAKVGYNISDYTRLSAHGGGNVLYRSIESSMNTSSGPESNSSLWKYYPNLGADLEASLGRNVSVLVRPDWTFTPGFDVFTGTVGLGIALG